MKYPKNQTPNGIKFMQFFSKPKYRELQSIANKKGITVQELIRAVMVPEWLEHHHVEVSKKRSLAMKKSWELRKKNAATAESSDEFSAPITPPPWETPKQ